MAEQIQRIYQGVATPANTSVAADALVERLELVELAGYTETDLDRHVGADFAYGLLLAHGAKMAARNALEQRAVEQARPPSSGGSANALRVAPGNRDWAIEEWMGVPPALIAAAS